MTNRLTDMARHLFRKEPAGLKQERASVAVRQAKDDAALAAQIADEKAHPQETAQKFLQYAQECYQSILNPNHYDPDGNIYVMRDVLAPALAQARQAGLRVSLASLDANGKAGDEDNRAVYQSLVGVFDRENATNLSNNKKDLADAQSFLDGKTSAKGYLDIVRPDFVADTTEIFKTSESTGEPVYMRMDEGRGDRIRVHSAEEAFEYKAKEEADKAVSASTGYIAYNEDQMKLGAKAFLEETFGKENLPAQPQAATPRAGSRPKLLVMNG